MSHSLQSKTSDCLVQSSSHFPSEFLRKMHSLAEVDRWKATEFRSFLLYCGPVVLKSHLCKDLYEDFPCLFVSVYIFLSPTLCTALCDSAEQLLLYFVGKFKTICGSEHLLYSVRSLIHLADDVRHFGPLQNVLAFPIESYHHSHRMRGNRHRPPSSTEQA